MARKRDEEHIAEHVPETVLPAGTVTKAWRITAPDSAFTGKLKYITFFDGEGALCAYGMAAECPENFVWEEPYFRQVKGTPIYEYARYFSDRGFIVEELSLEDGLALYREIEKKMRDYTVPVATPPPAPVEAIESTPVPKKAKGKAPTREVLPHEDVKTRGKADAD